VQSQCTFPSVCYELVILTFSCLSFLCKDALFRVFIKGSTILLLLLLLLAYYYNYILLLLLLLLLLISSEKSGKSSESVQCTMLKACDACADMGQL